MKKYIVFFLFILSSAGFASRIDYPCLHLEIVIKNKTSNTCYLMSHSEKNVYIYSDKRDLAFKILPGEESSILDISSGSPYVSPSIELQYECGEGRTIALHSEKNLCGNDNTTTAFLTSAANLNAKHETTIANYWSNQPARVRWTIF